MAALGLLHAMDLPGFWMDVGQPKDYIQGIGLYLSSLHKKDPSKLMTGPNIVGHVLVHPSAKIGAHCVLGPNVVVGPNVTIGSGVRISKTAIFEGVKISDHSWVSSCILGWHSTVGKWCRFEGVTVLGDDVHVADEIFMNGGLVLPHKSVKASVPEGGIVM